MFSVLRSKTEGLWSYLGAKLIVSDMELKVPFLELLVSSASHLVRAVHTQSLKVQTPLVPQILTASNTHSSDSEISSQTS